MSKNQSLPNSSQNYHYIMLFSGVSLYLGGGWAEPDDGEAIIWRWCWRCGVSKANTAKANKSPLNILQNCQNEQKSKSDEYFAKLSGCTKSTQYFRSVLGNRTHILIDATN
jgi:hypothetical protein